MNMRTKKRLGVLAGAAVLVAGVGVALAAYLSSGAGSGSADSTSAQASVVTAASTGTELYPGASTPITVSINNPNSYPVQVVSISAGSSQAVGAGGSCAAGTVTTAAVANPPTTTIAPGGSGTYTLTATMIADADNSCQNQSFTMPISTQLASVAG